MTNYIRDDNGYRWYFDARRGRIICADDRSRGRAAADDGYDCADLEDGVRVLNKLGYISAHRRRRALDAARKI